MQSRRRAVRGGRPSGNRRAPKRPVFWDDTIVNESLANGAVAVFGLDQGIPEDELKGITVTRLLLQFSLQAQTVNTSGQFHAGIYVAENDAVAALAVADPQTVSDDAGWMWRVANQVWASSNINDSSQFLRVREDLRAQRTYPGEDYTLIIHMVNNNALGSVNIDGIIRTLYKRA